MSYQVGVDVGGTFTTTAVVRGGRAEVVSVVPTELPGVPRGFLRRIGDDTPVLVGTRPVPAETLVAQLVSRAVAKVGTPASLAVTHPVTWGPHRVAALRAALGEVTMLSSAAAIAYQSQAPTAVHDLGGTTFTAAVVRGLATMGQPIELDLGGADLDELVFEHVRTALGDALPTDTATLTRLRKACTAAKETLSADTETEIPVANTRVRLTRAEFEEMARPLLAETAVALRMTIEESGVTPATVLLAGGAAWLPLLTQVVSEELGRPVTATPPGAAAMGAALAVAGMPAEPAFRNTTTENGSAHAIPHRTGAATPAFPGATTENDSAHATPRRSGAAAFPGAATKGDPAQGAPNRAGAPFSNPTRPGPNQPTRLAISLDPLSGNGSTLPPPDVRTSLVEPVRPPVPAAVGPVAARSRRPRTVVAVAVAAFAVVGAASAIMLTSGQTPPGAEAETMPTTTTVTQTASATTTDTTRAQTPTRQAPPSTRSTTPRPTTTTTKPAPTTTTSKAAPTTTTGNTTTSTTTGNTPPNSRAPQTSEGGDD